MNDMELPGMWKTADFEGGKTDNNELVHPVNISWYAVVNDLVGGWSIATVDLPLSKINAQTFTRHNVVADFICEKTTRYVAALHNRNLLANVDSKFLSSE